jgi:DNA-binding HxlR family transcriptional regulator
MTTKSRKPFSCGLGPALDVINGKWKPTILWKLEERAFRFGELHRSIQGITEKMLAAQLREMESEGLVRRQDFQELPLHVEYSLTKLGIELNSILHPLANWGKIYAEEKSTADK